jgi:Leu/Phe-tRNA-protein transferase
VEVWIGEELVGGLYGVDMGNVLSGARRASKSLQKCLNIHFKTRLVVDSQVGSTTLKVLNEVIGSKGLNLVLDKLIYEYKDNLIEASKLEGNEENYDGWMNRISHLSSYLRKL